MNRAKNTSRPRRPPKTPPVSGKRKAAATELVHAKEELERSRTRYSELFDFAPIAYFTFSARGLIDSLNVAAAELLKVERSRAVGSPADPFFEAESRAPFVHHLEGVLKKSGTHATDLVLAQADGERRHIHVVSRLIRGEKAHQPLCLSAAVDITERKKAGDEISRLNAALEQRVEQRTQELEESNQDLESFIYSVSHDLRAPLRNMAGFASIITEDYGKQLPPEVLGFVKRILAGNEKMLHLVDDLLRFSRLGRKPLEVTKTDLNQLLDEALADLGSEIAGREIEWHREHLPTVECDRSLMLQVFVNFLSNALKYTRPRQPAVITISCGIRAGERVIAIKDNGVGFDMRHADKLFGVFQRLHVPAEFEGNGVGLAMVSRILHRHGGQAYAEGQIGKGATFWFTFAGLQRAKVTEH